MAHGFVSSTNARGDLNLGALIAGKVKNAVAMSAEERKAREAEIQALENKKERTAEESERLEFLQNQDAERKEDGIKGLSKSFFAKAMMSEFGGDKLRRTKGIFSKNPEKYEDPSLTKEQRFSALLDRAAKPADPPVAPQDDIRPEEYGDAIYQAPTPQQGSLEKLLEVIKGQYATIAGKVSSLGSEEKKGVAVQESNTSSLARMTSVLESIKSYFNTDNKLKSEENKLEKDKIELQLDAEADAKASREATEMSAGEDLSTVESLDSLEDQKARNGGGKQKGLLGSLMDGVGGLFKMFGKGGGKTPGAKATTQYTKPIGPQPMNSSSPWAAKGAGDRGGMFGGGGFTPRMESAPKLSEGGTVPVQKFSEGVVTNPTTMDLPPGSSVIPLNRNNALAKTFKAAGETGGESKMSQPMAEVMQLPAKVGGGLLLSLLNVAMDKMGGLAHFVKPVIKQIATPVAAMFGLPATIVSGLFAGPAAAATMDAANGGGSDTSGLISKLTSMFGRSNPSSTAPPGSAGADLAGTSVVNEVSGQGLIAAAGTPGAHAEVGLTSRFGNRESPNGVGSTNHQGIDIGTSGQKGYKVAFQRGGTVTHAGTAGGFGNLVIIKDSAGTEYYFAHLANINPELTVGTQYTGQTIGEIGNTGTSTGEHLHFEKHPNAGAAVDPIGDIGLISIGKQTTAGTNNPLTAPVITNRNRPTPRQVAASTQLKAGQSGPVIPMPVRTPTPAPKTPPPAQGLSTIYQVSDPSWIDDPYLAWM